MYWECFNIVASELKTRELFEFGMNLKINPNEFDEIDREKNISNYQKTYQILRLWKQQAGQKADLEKIIEVLKKLKMLGIAEKLIETLS